jgi:hypothetical protein
MESEFNGDISKWNVDRLGEIDSMFCGSSFLGGLIAWCLSKQQLDEAFGETLPQYLNARKSVEERAQLYHTVGQLAKKKFSKKTL